MLLKGAYCVGEHFVDPQSTLPLSHCATYIFTFNTMKVMDRQFDLGDKVLGKTMPYYAVFNVIMDICDRQNCTNFTYCSY